MSQNLHLRNNVTEEEFELYQTTTDVTFKCMEAIRQEGLPGILAVYEEAFFPHRKDFITDKGWNACATEFYKHMHDLYTFVENNWNNLEWYEV